VLFFRHLWLATSETGVSDSDRVLFSGSFVLLCFSKGNSSGISKTEYKEEKKSPQGNEQVLLTSKRFAAI